MPNTLVHLCIQTPASRLAARNADFQWIALGCIIPDIPWILQRLIPAVVSGIDLIGLRIYAVIQASLFFCLLFSLAVSLLTIRPARIFLLLAFNVFIHLLLDALQIKWGNGVHLLAPFSWQTTHLSLFWPEDRITYFLSIMGLGILIVYGIKDWKKTISLATGKRNMAIAAILILGYFFAPFLMLNAPVRENNYYIATLRDKKVRTGKKIEIDRGKYRSADKTIRIFSHERLKLRGNIPRQDALLSVQGYFIDGKVIQVTAFHVHSFFRDYASMTGLIGVLLIWLFAIGRNKSTHKRLF